MKLIYNEKGKLMYDEKITLYEYCIKKGIPYYRLSYRVKHNPENKTLQQLIDLKPNYSTSKIKYLVTYKDKKLALNSALRLFFADNNLNISTNAGFFTKKIRNGGEPQALFDAYCKRILTTFKKEA